MTRASSAARQALEQQNPAPPKNLPRCPASHRQTAQGVGSLPAPSPFLQSTSIATPDNSNRKRSRFPRASPLPSLPAPREELSPRARRKFHPCETSEHRLSKISAPNPPHPASSARSPCVRDPNNPAQPVCRTRAP